MTTRPIEAPTPSTGPQAAGIGDVVQIYCNGSPCATVEIDEAEFVEEYTRQAGFGMFDKPADGEIYLQYHVTFTENSPAGSLDPLAKFGSYAETQFSIYVDGEVQVNMYDPEDGPTPRLGRGQLRSGESAAGWVVQAVPLDGTVVIGYAPEFPDVVFRTTVRLSSSAPFD